MPRMRQRVLYLEGLRATAARAAADLRLVAHRRLRQPVDDVPSPIAYLVTDRACCHKFRMRMEY